MASQRNLRRLSRRLGHDTVGAAAVEFALVAPVLIGLLLPMVDLGRGAFEKMRVQSAAEAGAQYALANSSSYSASAITTAAEDATNQSGLSATPSETCNCLTGSTLGPAVSCSTTCSDGSKPGTFVSVATQATYTPILAYPGIPSSMSLTGYAVVRTQ